MITLIIVDLQNDFISGTMSVKNAKNVLENLKTFIKNNKKDIDNIVFAINWRPYNHSSFKGFGGTMTKNCVQYTPGSCIEPKFLKFVQSLNIKYQVCTRNMMEEIEEPGALSDIDYLKDELSERYYFDCIAIVNASTDFVICGISQNFSIETTLKNMIKEGIYPSVLIRGIAGSPQIKDFCVARNLKVIENV